MKEHYYYLKDKNNNRVVSVCLLSHYGKLARGMALCSPSENFIRKKGIDKARGKAVKALKNKETSEPILREEAKLIIDRILKDNMDIMKSEPGKLKYLFEAKSVYKPKLLKFEKKILEKATKKRIRKM